MMQEISLLELLLWKETFVLVFFRRSFKEIVFLLILKNNLVFWNDEKNQSIHLEYWYYPLYRNN